MALDVEGFDQKVTGGVVSLAVNETHPLIKLCNVLPWQQLLEIILPDLKKTNKLLWWIGRPLRLRIHLGIYLLQKIYDLKDREAEAYLRDNAAFRLFCGFGILKKWHVPDHTKIEEFRSKLLPETQRQIANLFAVHAVRLGYANPKNLDIDSTVQKANISYPSTTNLLIKTSLIAKRLINALTTVGGKSKAAYKVNLKQIKDMALNCFNSRGDSSYKEKLQLLWREVFTAVLPILKDSYVLENKIKAGKYWKVRRALEQLHLRGALFLNKVHQEIFEGVKQNRIIHSLHAYAVHTFRTGKAAKEANALQNERATLQKALESIHEEMSYLTALEDNLKRFWEEWQRNSEVEVANTKSKNITEEKPQGPQLEMDEVKHTEEHPTVITY